MTQALTHHSRFPNARSTTLARLIVQERKTEQLIAEVEATVGSILIAELETALAGFTREQVDRIRESF